MLIGWLLTLIFVPVAAVAGWFYAQFTLQPIIQTARRRRDVIRFTIGDILCLVLLVQMVAAVPLVVTTPAANWSFFLPLSIAWCLVAAGWFRGATWLSRADIYDVWRRAVFLLIVLPAGFVVFVAIAAAFCFTVTMVIFESGLRDLPHTLGVFVFGMVASLGIRGLCGWLVKGDRVFFEGPAGDDQVHDSVDEGGNS